VPATSIRSISRKRSSLNLPDPRNFLMFFRYSLEEAIWYMDSGTRELNRIHQGVCVLIPWSRSFGFRCVCQYFLFLFQGKAIFCSYLKWYRLCYDNVSQEEFYRGREIKANLSQCFLCCSFGLSINAKLNGRLHVHIRQCSKCNNIVNTMYTVSNTNAPYIQLLACQKN